MTINHPQMTSEWFEEAVLRAMKNNCRVIKTGKPGILFVTSGSVDNLTYRVTRTECGCKGHLHTGRCQHRALAIAHADVIWPAMKRERIAA